MDLTKLMQWIEAMRKQSQGITFPVEKAITTALGANGLVDYAERRPSELGYPDSLGAEKALRHMLLAGELHRLHPWLADPLLFGHEYISNVFHGQPIDVRGKDLFNNSLGKYIGQRANSRQDVENWAQAAMSHADTKDYSVGRY